MLIADHKYVIPAGKEIPEWNEEKKFFKKYK